MDNKNNSNLNKGQLTVTEPDVSGEKIIFDIEIRNKLTHVIVNKNGTKYHINLDGEDLGYFEKDNKNNIKRYGQHKGAYADYTIFFKPIEDKIIALKK